VSLRSTRVVPGSVMALEIAQRTGEVVARDTDLLTLLRRPAIDASALAPFLPETVAEPAALQQIEIQAKYDGYIARQEEEIERLRRHESIRIPAAMDYGAIAGLSAELRQKLGAARPETLARASRIPGVTPAALSLLLVHARRMRDVDVDDAVDASDSAHA
jgi:tRNA uridine 5-carboxymethylaminomethyl modification enzyme